MNDTVERVAATCPSCSPDREVAHEVLAPGGQATVRCTECDHVHKTRIEEPETVELDVIVSQKGDSFAATTDTGAGDTVETGAEFVLDVPEALLTVRVTSIEVGDDQRTDSAPVEEVETLWTRVVGNVEVPVTLNPSDGRHDETRSVRVRVPGDREFIVGEREELADEAFTVKKLALRENATGYGFEGLDHEGDTAFAKDVQRIYADDESSSAWSAWG